MSKTTLTRSIPVDAARVGAERLLRAAEQIAAQAQNAAFDRALRRDIAVRRYNLLKALHMYRQRFGRGVTNEV